LQVQKNQDALNGHLTGFNTFRKQLTCFLKRGTAQKKLFPGFKQIMHVSFLRGIKMSTTQDFGDILEEAVHTTLCRFALHMFDLLGFHIGYCMVSVNMLGLTQQLVVIQHT